MSEYKKISYKKLKTVNSKTINYSHYLCTFLNSKVQNAYSFQYFFALWQACVV